MGPNSNLKMLLARAFVAVAACACMTAGARPGDIDAGFGSGGVAYVPHGPAGSFGRSAARQADGKLVVVAEVRGAGLNAALLRFNADGSADTSFGTSGHVAVPFGIEYGVAYAVAIQPDGKIVVVGTRSTRTPLLISESVVARFNPDGTPDNGFGTGGLVVAAADGHAVAVALQPDGKVLVAGMRSERMYVARLAANGTLDAAFGSGGVAILPFVRPFEIAHAIALQGDGRIVVAGGHFHNYGTDIETAFDVARLLPDGTLDATFAGSGATSIAFDAGAPREVARAVAIDALGRIVLVGHSAASWDTRWRIARLLADGSLDPSFGTGGKLADPLPKPYSEAHAVAIAADGKILVAGSANGITTVARFDVSGTPDATYGSGGLASASCSNDPATGLVTTAAGDAFVACSTFATGTGQQASLVHLLPGGTIDTTFGNSGVASTAPLALSPSTVFSAVQVQPDGRIVALGSYRADFPGDFFAARLLPDGSLDPGFGTGGKVDIDFGDPQDAGYALALQPDGKTVVVGKANGGFGLARLNADGTLDAAFGTAGRTVTATPSAAAARRVVLQPDGKIVVAASDGFVMARYTADGTLDASFGTGGGLSVGSTTEGGYDTFSSLILLPDGSFLAVGKYAREAPGGGGFFTVGLVARRISATGVLDTSFGNAGRATVPLGSGSLGVLGAWRTTDGKFLVAAGMGGQTVILKLLGDWTLDAAFGQSGQASSPGASSTLLPQANGKVVLAGRGDCCGVVVKRLLANGTVDAGFGNAGKIVTPIILGYAGAIGLAVQPDGKYVVVSADSNKGAAITRLLGGDDGIAPSPPDFDASGRGDLLWQNADGRAAIWLMDGLSVTASAEIIGAGTGWSVVQVADFDVDRNSDLVWQHTDGRMAIYLMNGTAPTTTTQLLNAGSGWSVIHTPDLDGDGKADLVFQNTDGSAAVWLMNGTVVTSGASIIGPGTGWSVTKVADFDGDGKTDLLWTHTDGRVAIWLMNGRFVKSTSQILNAGSGWSVIHTLDLNVDSKSDLVLQHIDGRVALWLMNGTAVASGAGLLDAGTGWSVQRVADFDGDGKGDLLFGHADGRAAIYLMNGLTPSAIREIIPAGGWTAKRTLDLNGDGKADIVWQNVDGSSAVWLMNGATLIGSSQLTAPGTGWVVSTAGR